MAQPKRPLYSGDDRNSENSAAGPTWAARDRSSPSPATMSVVSEVETAQPACSAVSETGGFQALARLAVRGSIWTIAAFAIGQALRLASNLVLTRLLFPEAFGLMAIVTVIIQSLQLFSDFGIRGSVVNHPRGDDPVFLNTAWTFRVIRGCCLWIILCLLAQPVARFYGEPILRVLIPIVALTAVIDGLTSTAIFTLQRHVRAGKLAALDLGTQTFSIVLMIGWASLWPSIWALVVAALGGKLLYAAVSHMMCTAHGNRFAWEPEAARAFFRYGRWIFVATAMTFIASHVDRAVLGKFITMSQLGIYSIAAMLSQFLVQASQSVGQRILFPIYAKLARNDRADMRRLTFQFRTVLLASLLPPLWCLILWGPQIVELLYDPRYAEAGWMLQILAAGATSIIIIDSAQTVLLAHADSFRHMLLQLIKAGSFIGCGAAGGVLAGVPGFLVGIAASRVVAYPAMCLSIRRYGVWLPGLDMTALTLSACVAAVAAYIR